jgi:hypothetical protein
MASETRRLGPDGEEGRERGGRAFVHVGAPHVPGHGGDLVADPAQHEDDRHHQGHTQTGLAARGGRHRQIVEPHAQRGQVGAARKPDYGDTPEHTVDKELEEETALAAKNVEFLFYQNSPPTEPGKMHCLNLYFR